MPFLEDLYEVTHEHVHLAVRDHLDVVFVERISGREASIPVLSRAGGRIGQFATGAGLVLLAHAPPDVQEEILNSPIPRYTKNTITDPRRLRATLAGVRRNGYSTSDGMIDLIVLSVGAPVTGSGGSVVAAVSVAVASGSRHPTAIAPLVRAAGLGISRALRAPSHPDRDARRAPTAGSSRRSRRPPATRHRWWPRRGRSSGR
jgi:DNA-binding IclR family transcriptional regulator